MGFLVLVVSEVNSTYQYVKKIIFSAFITALFIVFVRKQNNCICPLPRLFEANLAFCY